MKLPWVSRRRFEWAYQRGQLQGNADARRAFRDRIEELESFDANEYLATVHNAQEAMRAACIAAVEAMDIHGCHRTKGILDCNCIGTQVVAALREVQP